MPEYKNNIFVCGNKREKGHPRGCCDPDGSDRIRSALKNAIKENKTFINGPVRVNQAGCLDQCEHGPVVVIYPQSIWYGNVKATDADRIVRKTLIKGEILDDLLISNDCLNNPNCPHRTNNQVHKNQDAS